MSITKRQEEILKLLNENRYMTVSVLSELMYTSESSIRRDLSRLENMCFIKRTHGGASILDDVNHPANLNSRMTKNSAGKRRIAKKAAQFLQNGISIMLDSSTTAGYLIPYISKYEDITVFTNNMITAVNAVNLSVKTYCLGGECTNNSPILTGAETCEAVKQIHPDILFFSSHSISKDGLISDPTPQENYIRKLMLENAHKSVFLCDSEKFNRISLYTLTSVNNADACVFDVEWKGFNAKCRIL